MTGTWRALLLIALLVRPSEGRAWRVRTAGSPPALKGKRPTGAGEVTSGGRSGRRPRGTYAPRSRENFRGPRGASRLPLRATLVHSSLRSTNRPARPAAGVDRSGTVPSERA